MRSKFWMWMEVIMLIAWIVVTIIFLSNIRTSGTQCKANPLVYASRVLGEQNNATFEIWGKFSNEPNYIIYANAQGWKLAIDPNAPPIEEGHEAPQLKLNLSQG